MTSDDELIDELRAGLAARSADLELPDGLVTRARHTAQRRSARRAAIAGVPALLVVAAVGVVASGGLGSSGPTADAAYIKQQIVDHLVQDQAGRSVGYEVDRVTPDHGSTESWSYTDPKTHVSDTYSRVLDSHGRLGKIVWTTLTVHGRRGVDRMITVDPGRRTWSVHETHYSIGHPTQVSAGSSPTQIAHALTTGAVTRAGRVTLGGHPAIKIHVPGPAVHEYSGYLYVDARTYRPLKSVMSMRDGIQGDPTHRTYTYTTRQSWLPASSSNIALATRRPPIPAGYRKVKYRPPDYAFIKRELLRDLRRARARGDQRAVRALRAELRKLG